MQPLDDAAREALTQYRASLGVSPAAAQRQWATIKQRAELDDSGSGHDRFPLWFRVGVAMVAIAATTLLVVSVSSHKAAPEPSANAGLSVDQGPATTPEQHVVDHPQQNSVLHSAPEDDQGPSEFLREVTTPPPRAGPSNTAPRPRTRSTPRPPVDPIAQLRAETQLLRRARTAMRQGASKRALALAREHGRRFRDGVLREEMDLLRLHALCELGSQKRWDKARLRFEQRYPNSPLRVHLRDDCFE